MDRLVLHKTFEVYDDGPEQWATYHWGELVLSEYSAVTWRGTNYMVQTADNPFDFLSELSDAVMSLEPWELWPTTFDARQQVEWWVTQQPGLLLGLEVKEDGHMWAEVWTGLVKAWGDTCVTTTPQLLLQNWHEVVLMFNGEVNILPDAQMLGPVGLITEVQPYEGNKFDRDFWIASLR